MNIREIARKVGLSKSTVSLALRDHPSIPPVTRKRIKALAKKLGYQPDPTIAKVMGAIAKRAAGEVTAPLVLLSDWPASQYWLNPDVGLRRFHRGLTSRAMELGYRLEEFWIRAPGMLPRRVEQILDARGTQGIVVLNYPEAPAKLPLDLSPYACVVIGRALVQPRLYAVDHDHHQGLFECLKQVSDRGYRRPGLVLTADAHERTMHCWAAAYQFFLSHLPRRDQIPFLLIAPDEVQELKKWVKAYRPDVILSADFTMARLLEKAGFAVPGDVSLATLFWREEDKAVAGIDTQDEAQSARAIDLLIEQMRRNQHGIPHKPETVLFDGFWRDGPSLPTRQK
ncbi:LacI family DNA-binding transcriptional regulator [Oleiharenicola lentus]|uniref:LacI family DNA-binding transcriptional regulator n=1 Tax=Oleiharenicola lentus TaxID=2508720 RepID=UPI003F66EC9C